MATTRSGKSQGRKGARSRASGHRERISPRGDTRFVRRTAEGRFKESDDAGRSMRTDRRKKAKRTVKAGYGDRGDQPRRAGKRTRA
jgi:hypothetical protein